jgi:hypothetical protein
VPVTGPELPALTGPALAERYAASRRALVTARDTVTGERRAVLAGLAKGERQFLAVDPRGDGTAVEVVGDLAGAERVVVLVPGSDTTLGTFDRRDDQPYAAPAGGARALYAQARTLAPEIAVAVVGWLGYDAPATLSREVLGDAVARDGAGALRRFVAGVARGDAEVSLVCHSYGSTLCGHAAGGLPVTDVVVAGSPGMPPWRSRARLWATRGATDWVRRVPAVSLLGGRLGLGADPLDPGSGARVLDSGDAGHSEYLRSGGDALRVITNAAIRGESGIAVR